MSGRNEELREPCWSISISNTFKLTSDRAPARHNDIVVFPTPPLLLQIPIFLMVQPSFRTGKAVLVLRMTPDQFDMNNLFED
jgi:hypothetical protein